MVQRREHASLTLEARDAVLVVGECFGKQFDGDAAMQLRVFGQIHFTHPACAQMTNDFVTLPPSEPASAALVIEGQQAFQFDAFRNEQLWYRKLSLHEVVEGAFFIHAPFDPRNHCCSLPPPVRCGERLFPHN